MCAMRFLASSGKPLRTCLVALENGACSNAMDWAISSKVNDNVFPVVLLLADVVLLVVLTAVVRVVLPVSVPRIPEWTELTAFRADATAPARVPVVVAPARIPWNPRRRRDALIPAAVSLAAVSLAAVSLEVVPVSVGVLLAVLASVPLEAAVSLAVDCVVSASDCAVSASASASLIVVPYWLSVPY